MTRALVGLFGVTLAALCGLGAPAAAQETGDPVRGKRLFLQCQACHSLATGASGSVGPTLSGVVGRKAASVAGYTYSPALAASGLIWDESTLEKWLEHPTALVPATKMIFAGVSSHADRLSIIAFLRSAP